MAVGGSGLVNVKLSLPVPGERVRCAAVPIDPSFWEKRAVLLTGHTGFKGAWLSLWLQSLGARVSGLSAGPPSKPSLYELAGVGEGMEERSVDIRDAEGVRAAVREVRPQIVLHLAAQPLVRRSFDEPLMTFEVNVMGTANVLEAVRVEPGEIEGVLVVTSDKCYENLQGHAAARGRHFVEGDPLGGNDPYSSSKACAELVTAAYRRSFFGTEGAPRLGSARAGNVIGGGDWGEDRLIPDVVRAVSDPGSAPLLVRNPNAVRPWQHVLNPLAGYLMLAQELARPERVLRGSSARQDPAQEDPAQADAAQEDPAQEDPAQADAAQAWNFGPDEEDTRTVGWVVGRLAELWEGALRWEVDERQAPPEAGWLSLDSSRAHERLGWRSVWGLDRSLEEVVSWHEAHRRGEDARVLTLAQIGRYLRELGSE